MQKIDQDIASIFAGLGLFFVGIKQLRSHLKQLAGPRFTTVVTRMSDDARLAPFWGLLVGFVTQSGRVTAMLLASLTSGGVLTVQRALPMVIWANVGCSLIVFSAILPVNLLVLLLIGVSGICVAFEFPRKQLGLQGAAFGLALLMFGLSLIKISTEHMVQGDTLDDLARTMGTSEPMAFTIGLVLTIVSQSHMGVILIAAAMAHTKLFTLGQLAMIVYGAHAGAGAVTYLFGVKSFEGSSRQLVTAQVLYNFIGVALFVPLHLIETMFGVPLVLAAAGSMTHTLGGQTAVVAVLFNVVTAACVALAVKPFHRVVTRVCPPLVHEELAKPKYVNLNAVESPETAAILVGKEQLRLLKRLPGYIQALRQQHATPAPPSTEPPAANPSVEALDAEARAAAGLGIDIETQHAAFHEVVHRTELFLVHVLRQSPALHTTEALLNLQNRLGQLSTLEDDLYVFVKTLAGKTEGPRTGPLVSNIVESLDAAILTAIVAIEESDAFEFEHLAAMTNDKSNVIRMIRAKYLALEQNLSIDDRTLILQATSLFERTAWTIGRYGLLASPVGSKE